jgi:heptosyltransferase-2
MNIYSLYQEGIEDPDDSRPILIVPYMWIGDFVRGHTVVRVLKQRWPNRPVDLLVTSQCAPLVDYMPGVRSGVGAGGAAARPQLRHRADPAPHLEVRDCARARRHPGTGGFRRRSPIRADQPLALG